MQIKSGSGSVLLDSSSTGAMMMECSITPYCSNSSTAAELRSGRSAGMINIEEISLWRHHLMAICTAAFVPRSWGSRRHSTLDMPHLLIFSMISVSGVTRRIRSVYLEALTAESTSLSKARINFLRWIGVKKDSSRFLLLFRDLIGMMVQCIVKSKSEVFIKVYPVLVGQPSLKRFYPQWCA